MLRRLLKFSLRLGVLAVIVAVVVRLLDDREAPRPITKVEPPRPTQPPSSVEPELEPEPQPKPDPEPEQVARDDRPLRAELIEEVPPPPANRKVPVDAKPAEKRAEMVSWVEPHGTVCPTSHPIKAKLGSKVFRKPETPGYDNSKPDRCYASEGAARRGGFREAQR